jgi:hypothetical protein
MIAAIRDRAISRPASTKETNESMPAATIASTPGLRRLPRLLATSALVVGALLAAQFAVAVGVAQAAPLWNLDIHHDQTNFPPGGTAELSFDLRNLGDSPSSGPVTLAVDLPAGLTRDSFRLDTGTFNGTETVWTCPGSSGDSAFICTSANPNGSNRWAARNLILTVDVASDAPSDLVVNATVAGGGAPDASPAAVCPPTVAACATESIHVSADPAPFGIVDGSWIADFYESDSVTPVRQAGSHPDLATFSFDFNSVQAGITQGGDPQKSPSGSIRDVQVDLPPGFLGDPTAIAECSPAQLNSGACPRASQVGILEVTTQAGFGVTSRYNFTVGLFNMQHPRGSITDLGATITAKAVHIRVSLDPANNYSVRTVTANINETVRPMHTRVTVWGIPGDPKHDVERGGSFGIPIKPFLTVPARCGVDHQMKFSRYDSWQQSGVFGPDLIYDLPGQFIGCDLLRFEPDVTVDPTNQRADSPTGLEVTAEIPQSSNADGLATPPVKRIEVKLPEGMSLNPSFAEGLDGCTPAQIGLGTNDPVQCADNSRIGSVELSTPVLPEPLEGSIYLAKQQDHPFNTLFAMYTVVHDTEDRGVLIKIPGKIELDPATGQITTTFDDLPELPFDGLTTSFRSGARAPLVNPATCGTKTIEGTLNTWAAPNVDVDVSTTYTITEGPGGGACSPTLASRPFAPVLSAGTQHPLAGSYSPFVLRLTRQDGEQELTRLTADLPPGLTGKLAGISRCSDASLASIPADPGTGAAEKANPSCPANSKVGYANAGSGSGTQPLYVGGSAYLAGPYDPDGAGPLGTAPVSVAVVTPAVVGGIDLGNVVIRSALYVDQDDAQLHVVSGPIPTIIHGVPIHLRDVRVVADRPGFTLNPTNCDVMQVTGTAGGASTLLNDPSDDITAPLTDRFQVGGCGALGLGPKMTTTLLNGRAGIGRSSHPNLLFNLGYRYGDANLRRVELILPKAFQIDQANLGNICSETQLAANECAGRQRVGTASAVTPLLDQPLNGIVYAVSGSGGLPKLAIILHGPPELPIKLVVRGLTDTVGARIRNTIPIVPDAPVTSFALNIDGGPQGYLVNNQNLCTKVQGKGKGKRIVRAGASASDITYFGHNGDTYRERSVVGVDCGKKGKKSKKHQAK